MNLENRFVSINEIYQSIKLSRWNFQNDNNFSLPFPGRFQATNKLKRSRVARKIDVLKKKTSISRGKRMKWPEDK